MISNPSPQRHRGTEAKREIAACRAATLRMTRCDGVSLCLCASVVNGFAILGLLLGGILVSVLLPVYDLIGNLPL